MNYSDCFISIAEEEIQYISLYGSHLLTFIRVWVEAKHSHLITPPVHFIWGVVPVNSSIILYAGGKRNPFLC